jgi:hypothetical protein
MNSEPKRKREGNEGKRAKERKIAVKEIYHLNFHDRSLIGFPS